MNAPGRPALMVSKLEFQYAGRDGRIAVQTLDIASAGSTDVRNAQLLIEERRPLSSRRLCRQVRADDWIMTSPGRL